MNATISLNAMTYNICNVHPNNITKAGASLEKYGWSARSGRVFEVIKSAMPAFLCCQELRDQETKDGKIERLEGQFYQQIGSEGYDFYTAANNGDRLSFKLLTAHKTDLFFNTNVYKWWNNTTNPERFGDTAGNSFGRVTLMTKYYNVMTDAKGVKQPDYSAIPIYMVNTHPGLKHAERMHHHLLLIDQVHKIIGLEKAIVCVMGDYNCFPDDGGEEELALYEKRGFTNVKHLTTTTNLPIDGSFLGYFEYDKFVPQKGKMGSLLDRAMIKVMNGAASVEYKATIDLNKYNGKDPKNPQSIEEYLVDSNGTDLRGDFPSDHAPLHVKATIRFE